MDNAGIDTRLVLSAAAVIGIVGLWSPQTRAADIALKAPPEVAQSSAPSSVLWLGGDFKQNVDAGTIGGIYGLTGNLDSPGWLLRGQFTGVGFDFATGTPIGTGNGDFYRGDASIGYQVTGDGLVASGYVGVDYEQYNFRPAGVGSSQLKNGVGAMLVGRLATMGGAQYPFGLDGQFETVNDEFWLRARTGIRFDRLTIGPEVIGLGNVAFDEVRFGGYISYDLLRNLVTQIDAGYADGIRDDNSGRGGSGVYGAITLVFLH